MWHWYAKNKEKTLAIIWDGDKDDDDGGGSGGGGEEALQTW